MITFGKIQHLAIQSGTILVLAANWQWWHSPLVGILAGFFYLFFNSKKLGDIFFDKARPSFKNILGLLTIIIYLSLLYTTAYHFYQINDLIFWVALLSIPLAVEIISRSLNREHYYFTELDIPNIRLANIKNLILPLIILILDGLTFWLLFRRATVEVLRSPWEILDAKFWLLLIVSTILLVIFILHSQQANKPLFLMAVHFLLFSSIALILYPLGFGYDPFIHQANMKIIAETGTLNPRLFLYIGQYGQIFFLSDLWQISLNTINKLFMPFAFSLFWPYTLYYGLRYGLNWPRRMSMICILASLLVGFNFAIMSTPQNLTFLLFAIFIFLIPVIRKGSISLYFGLSLSLAALTIHPLGGIPLLYSVVLLMITKSEFSKLWKSILYYLSLLGAAISLPLLLALYQRLAGRSWQAILTWHPWPLIDFPPLQFYSAYSWPLDMLHNLWDNRFWLFFLLLTIGLVLIIKKNKVLFFKRHLTILGLLISNYLLARLFISFDTQIAYEQTAYLLRITYLISLTALPIILTAFYFWWRPYTEKNNFTWYKLWLTVLTSLLLFVSLYFSYPVYDRYTNSKSFNVTAADLETVTTIEQTAGNQPYIVLANQMVGAAAINTYGFAHYYPAGSHDNFYYSMPLGIDNIYQNFLNMIEAKADRAEALAAMDKAEVDRLYFVVNNYWHSAKTAISQAKTTADEYFTVSGEKNYVFVYYR